MRKIAFLLTCVVAIAVGLLNSAAANEILVRSTSPRNLSATSEPADPAGTAAIATEQPSLTTSALISLANEAPDLGVQQVSMEVADAPAAQAKAAKCCEQESCCFSACDPRWTVQADAIFLSRIGAPDVTLIQDFATAAELLNARDFEFPFAAGPKLSLQRRLENDWAVELAYFGIDGHRSYRERQSPTGEAFLAPNFGAFAVGAPMGFDWDSRLYNAEINLRLQERPWLTPFIGFRWLELDEHLAGSWYTDPLNISRTYFWDTRAVNNLYGIQLGTDVHLWKNDGPFRVEGIAKAGIYNNSVSQASSCPLFTDDGLHARIDRIAFIGEIGLTGVWQISDHLAGRIGYQVMWLEGVALPPAQIALSNVSTRAVGVSADGGVFYHGANAGLEVKF